jgi:hypothetical protein
MRILGPIVVIALLAGLIVALLNQALVTEVREIRLPGGRFAVAALGSALLAAAGVIVLMLLVAWVQEGLQHRALGRALARLAQREHEIAEMKSRAYDDVSEKLDVLRDELARRLPAHGDTVVEEEPVGLGPLAER